jgi:DNA end-binding protein Ku
MARLLLESMASDWDPEKYQDTHRLQVEAIIEAKRQGDEIVTGTEARPVATNVVDLMEVLSASVDSVKAAGQAAGKAAPRATAKKATAPATKKRAAPKKPTPIKSTTKATAKTTKAKAPARRKAS